MCFNREKTSVSFNFELKFDKTFEPSLQETGTSSLPYKMTAFLKDGLSPLAESLILSHDLNSSLSFILVTMIPLSPRASKN